MTSKNCPSSRACRGISWRFINFRYYWFMVAGRLFPGLGLIFFLWSGVVSLWAMPTFSYQSALTWLQDTVRSEIPLSDRMYVLGPDRTKEFYGLNQGISTHDLETRITVSAKTYHTLAALIAELPYKGRKLVVRVWRSGNQKKQVDWPVYVENIAQARLATFALLPQDIIEFQVISDRPGIQTM